MGLGIFSPGSKSISEKVEPQKFKESFAPKPCEITDVGLVNQSRPRFSSLMIKSNVGRSATLSRLVGRSHPSRNLSKSETFSTVSITSSYDAARVRLSADSNTSSCSDILSTMQIHPGPDLISLGSKSISSIQIPHQIQYGSIATSSFRIPHQIPHGSSTSSIHTPNVRLRDKDNRNNLKTTNVLPSSIMSSVLCPSQLTTHKYSTVAKPSANSVVSSFFLIPS